MVDDKIGNLSTDDEREGRNVADDVGTEGEGGNVVADDVGTDETDINQHLRITPQV